MTMLVNLQTFQRKQSNYSEPHQNEGQLKDQSVTINNSKKSTNKSSTKYDLSFSFQIRCKVISISTVQNFGANKVIDGIVCDKSGEIKIVAFHEQANRALQNMKINEKLTSNLKYRSPFSKNEIHIYPSTTIQKYESTVFDPLIQIKPNPLREI
ncbi:unnamed protein product [Adineta steineri]|uniref:Uncharacterized protein n=1 Tax=Adineta steineri TaxID=433720 RepID=A0A815SCV9_9BILA|nr:unnamed protein product [Adineta steineri]CAF1490434.1 unnamed protein product [Adineta steineri]